MSLGKSLKVLTTTLKSDPDYRRAWQANIAMAFYDEIQRVKKHQRYISREKLHEVSNNAANYFLDNLCR